MHTCGDVHLANFSYDLPFKISSTKIYKKKSKRTKYDWQRAVSEKKIERIGIQYLVYKKHPIRLSLVPLTLMLPCSHFLFIAFRFYYVLNSEFLSTVNGSAEKIYMLFRTAPWFTLSKTKLRRKRVPACHLGFLRKRATSRALRFSSVYNFGIWLYSSWFCPQPVI